MASKKVPRLSSTRLLELKRKELELLKEKQVGEELLPHIFFPMYAWQRKIIDSENRVNLLTAANQIGKANELCQKVPTPLGYRLLGDIEIGDQVFGSDGKICKVLDIPFVGEDEFFEIVFSDGDVISAGQNHLWICKGPEERFRKAHRYNRGAKKGRVFPNPVYGKWQVRSTKEIFEHTYSKGAPKPTRKYTIPYTQPVEYAHRGLFDPYYVGLWLGNGCKDSISFNLQDGDLTEYAKEYGNLRAYPHVSVIGILKPTREKLFELGLLKLSYEKEIPEEYLLGAIEQRKSLLAGLLDTDGYTVKGNIEFCTTSQRLATQVKELVHSLGGIAQVKLKESPHYTKDNGERVFCKDAYRISIWTLFNPFRSKRKSVAWKPNTRYSHEKVIEKITPIGKRRGKCITVSSDDNSFLITRNYIVTHNSSALIRRVISNATDPRRWTKFWGKGVKPRQFWYFYPDGLTLEKEVETKWVPEWLPRGPMEADPQYGWKLHKKSSTYTSLKFNAGPTIYFQMYTKSVRNVQSSSVHEVYADEELPMEFYDELMFRLTVTNGIFNSGFTPTLNQLFWKQAMESNKVLPSALKLEVSMYDCLVYEDGSPSRIMTLEKIRNAEEKCKNETEKQRRIFGKFVTESGRTYFGFEYEKNVKPPYDITGWLKYAAVDYGSGTDSEVSKGGKRAKNHPAAITFIAVRPDYKKGAIFKCWRGDGIKTTAGDVFNKYIELRGRIPVVQACYDPGAKDFGTIADRNGESFTKADKSRDAGIDLVNTLFKHDMLDIFDEDPENLKLASELLTVMVTNQQSENKSGDDLCDAARYNIMQIPWDLSMVAEDREKKEDMVSAVRPMTEADYQVQQIKLRRGEKLEDMGEQDQGWGELEDEFNEWNHEYGNG